MEGTEEVSREAEERSEVDRGVEREARAAVLAPRASCGPSPSGSGAGPAP